MTSAFGNKTGRRPIDKLPAAAKGYAIALGSLTLATLISIAVIQIFGSHPLLRVPFLLAFMVSAWFGYGPGLFAWFLGFFVVPFVLNPQWMPARIDKNNLFMVLVVVILISRMRQTREGAESRLRSANEDLDRRIRERTADLARSNSELQRLNVDLNEFAHSASHDLKEPLRMVITFSQLLERKFSNQLGSEGGGEYVRVIVHGGQRMDALLDDLLAYAHVVNTPDEFSDGQSATTTTDASLAVQKALKNLNTSVAESRAEVTCGKLPVLVIREVHLVQIFQNLISNAIKYCAGDAPRVQIRGRRRGTV